MIDQSGGAFKEVSRLNLTQKFDLLQAQKCAGHLSNSFQHRQLILWFPREALLHLPESCFNRLFDGSFQSIAQCQWKEQNFATIRLGTLAGCSTGDGRNPFHQRAQQIIGPGDCSFRKDHQGPVPIFENFHGKLQGGSIDPFPVDAEGPHRPDQKSLNRPFHEQMPAGHNVEEGAGRLGKMKKG